MTPSQLIPLALKASIFLLVFAIGLGTRREEAVYVFRHPALLVRSIVAMNVVMPVFAVAAVFFLDLPAPIRIALIALAVSPVPPIIPRQQEKAGGPASYAIGLMVAASVVSLVLAPIAIELVGRAFDRNIHVPFGRVLGIILLTVIVPLAIGTFFARLQPPVAERIQKPVALAAAVILALAVMPVLFTMWPIFRELIGRGVLAVLVLFTLVGLAVGHLLGGPDPDHRSVLALATATRHPAVAIAIASVNFPEERAVAAVVVFHLIVGALVSLPYVSWRQRVHALARP